ncbi:Psilocybin Transporter (PsiT) [Psilocybe cyanescens]|uniref:Psilocybin Transporter (PsiT) n=1 Tax=Psilocybe cyanescens TaxID=93625 RepID=A0A409WXK0_PSICY|nr:Psilocybin Transporter (PsiT) [Psilocybe cyanescens]
MAPVDGTSDERTSLLSGRAQSVPKSTTTTERQSRSSRKSPWVSPVTIITIITLVYRLATTLLTTTTIRVLHKIACQLWFHVNDPDAFPGGHIPEQSCATPGVNKYYSMMISTTTIVDGLGGIFGTGVASYLSSRVGRKPVLIFLLACTMTDHLAILTVQNIYGWTQFAIFGLIAIVETIGNENTTVFLVSMYIVDITEAEQRYAINPIPMCFSRYELIFLRQNCCSEFDYRVACARYLCHTTFLLGYFLRCRVGGALAYSIGGFITTYSHSDSIVYVISFVVVGLVLTFTAFVLPESFSAERRELLRLKRLAETPTVSHTLVQKVKAIAAVALEPLELLKPTYNPLTGKPNRRLVYCSVHTFIVTVADAYAAPAMLIFFTTQYSYTPAQVGYVMSTYSFSSVFVLAIGLPLVIRWLKPLYSRTQAKSIPEEDENNEAIDPVDRNEPLQEVVVSGTSDNMDVHITVISWAIESLTYIGLGTMGTFYGQLLAVASVGVGSGRIPGCRSLVAASVDPLKQGEALASVEMVSNVGRIISPMIMGTIMTATISTNPQMIFYVHAAIVAVGAPVLFLVRDSDRYQ